MNFISRFLKRKSVLGSASDTDKSSVLNEEVVQDIAETEQNASQEASLAASSPTAVNSHESEPSEEVYPINPSLDEETQQIITELNAAGAPAESLTGPHKDPESAETDNIEVGVIEPESKLSFGAKLKNLISRRNSNVGAGLDAAIPQETIDTNIKPKSNKKFSLRVLLGLENSTTGVMPIKVLIGYLPDVSERDILEYAIGIAEKNFDQLALVHYDAFKYDGGYVYELHEGGSGKAFVPEIIKYFESTGEFDPSNFIAVVIDTATKKVEVQKLRQGLTAVLLPESTKAIASDFIEPKQALISAFNQRTGFFVISAIFFIVSFFAMVVAMVAGRYQPYDEPTAHATIRLDTSKIPSTQWSKIEEASKANKIVKAIKYSGGNWDVVITDPPKPVEAASAPSAPASSLNTQ